MWSIAAPCISPLTERQILPVDSETIPPAIPDDSSYISIDNIEKVTNAVASNIDNNNTPHEKILTLSEVKELLKSKTKVDFSKHLLTPLAVDYLKEKNAEENQIEVQYQLHKWDDRLEKSLDRVLGERIRNEVMKDRDKLFTIESSCEDRIQWLKDMLSRIDKITTDDEKYEILSCCAHEFSKKRIQFF